MQRSDRLRCFPSTFSVAIIFIISCPPFLPIEAKIVGFSIDLIHRDSPQSPLYNPNISYFERLSNAFQRSLGSSSQIGTTSLIEDGGAYLMKISYGTPSIEYFSVVDTGSELSWIQCLPCIKCYPSQSSPFNPRYSRTFQSVLCSSKKPCSYELKYMDNSYSRGELAKDTITVGSRIQKVSFPNFVFGCGHDNTGSFPHKGAGLVGFGPEKDSFVSQLSSANGGKFSFCMAPPTLSPGRISFGAQAVVSGPGVVSTPLILGDHYYLMLQAVTVGTKRLRYIPDQPHFLLNDSRKVNGGKIAIDSGSTLTFLSATLQSQVEATVRRLLRIKPMRNPPKPFAFCYSSSSARMANLPKMKFHFAGADLELLPGRTFVMPSPSTVCLAILPTKNTPIFGNVAQRNFLVGYDLVKKTVSFKQTDCSKY